MKVLVIEDNLMWASRLAKSVTALGHIPVLVGSKPESPQACEVAIVNLGSPSLPPEDLVPLLKSWGLKIVAHAGHKEKLLLELGKNLDCDVLATNSELTWKLKDVLSRAG